MPERVLYDNRFKAYRYNKIKTYGKIAGLKCNVCREGHLGHILILGAGKFGLHALRAARLRSKNRVTVVDTDPKRGIEVTESGGQFTFADSILFLSESLKGADPPDWIIPAVPLHVTFEWLRTTLPEVVSLEKLAVPNQVKEELPHPMPGTDGQLYVSHADFICPDDCPEPADICTYTGNAREPNLYEILAKIQFEDYTSVVVRSRQLAPGVGGIRPNDLFAALGEIVSSRGPVLLSTACKCHGVIQAFRLR